MALTSLAGSERERGFSLMELMLAMLLFGIFSALALPRFEQLFTRQHTSATVRSIVNSFYLARTTSINTQATTEVVFDLQNQRLFESARKRFIHLPADVQITLLSADTEARAGGIAGFRFYPDGSNTGGRVVLNTEGFSYAIDLDWLTGRVSLYEP